MSTTKVAVGIRYVITFFTGMIVASYYPLPGIDKQPVFSPNPKPIECPVGFATFEEMKSLVEELRKCTNPK